MKTLFLAGAAALAVAAPAAAAPVSFYFDCGDAPVTNISEAPLTWSPTAPTTALQDGGGCLSGTYQAADTQFGGTYAGEVKQIALDVYGAVSNPVYRKLLGVALDVTIAVDGTTVFEGKALGGGNEAAGPLPGGFRTTITIPELDIPATDAAKSFVITVADPYGDDPYVIGRGAKDLPSGITFYAQDDLPDPEEDPGP